MRAPHPSLDAGEPEGSAASERASRTERPPAPPSISTAASDARLQAALSATSRADASLSTLMRAVKELTTGVSSAREANIALVAELGALADLLSAANERQLALKNRVALLEQALVKAEKDAKNERAYILEQQDAFIVGMLEDHEHAVAELRREVEVQRERASQRPTASPASQPALDAVPSSVPNGPPTERAPAPDVRLEVETAKRDVEKLLAERERMRETLLKLQAQRDEAQAAVVKLTRERELARAEGGPHRIGDAVRQAIPVHTPTPTPAGRMASTQPPESPRGAQPSPSAKPGSSRNGRTEPFNDRSLRQTDPMPVGVTRSPAPDYAARVQRVPSPPPEELRAALHPPSTPLPPEPLMTPAPATPRGPEARLIEPTVPTVPPPNSRPKPEPSLRPTGGYSMTNSVAPERVNTSAVSRPPRR